MSYCEYWSTRVVGTWCWGKQLCVCSCVRVLQHGQLIIGCGWTVHTWKDEGTLQILAVGHRHVRRRGQNRVAAKTLMSDLIFWAPTPPSRTTQTSPYILIYYRCYLFSAVGGPLDPRKGFKLHKREILPEDYLKDLTPTWRNTFWNPLLLFCVCPSFSWFEK